MFMSSFKRVASLALMALAAGCDVHLQSGSSNFPDSGLTCSADAGSGSASLSGPASFTVQAAHEKREGFAPNDGGQVLSSWLTFSLYEQAVGCGAQGPDGGVVAARLSGLLFDPAAEYTTGQYPVTQQDGGRMALVLFATPVVADGGTTAATGGFVELTAIAPCSLAGTFTLTFGSPDAGTTALSGSFSPNYCP
jgi:hypothetical protein